MSGLPPIGQSLSILKYLTHQQQHHLLKECIFLTKIFCKGSLRLTVANAQGGLSHTTGTPCKGFLRRRHIDAVFVTKLDRLPAWCVFLTLAAVFVERQKTIVKRGKNQLYLIEPPASQPLLCTSLYFLLFPFLNIAM